MARGQGAPAPGEAPLGDARLDWDGGAVAGYYTLATGQVDFSDLPADVVRRLPRRRLPVAVLAWLGVHEESQGRGLGRLLLARALRECYDAGHTFAVIAVILDCIGRRRQGILSAIRFSGGAGAPVPAVLELRAARGHDERRLTHQLTAKVHPATPDFTAMLVGGDATGPDSRHAHVLRARSRPGSDRLASW